MTNVNRFCTLKRFSLIWYLCLSQAALECVAGVSFASQALQVSFQSLFGLPDILQQFRGFCARFHCLGEVRGSEAVSGSPDTFPHIV